MTDENNNPTPTTPPDNTPSPTPTPEPKAPENKPDDETAKLKAELEAAKAKAAALEKEKADEAEKKRLAELSAEEKAKELETKLAETQRQNLINEVRLKNGYTASVFQHFKPEGSTEDEIKASFDAYKTSLDEYSKGTGPKPGQGTPKGQTQNNQGKNPNTNPTVPILLREGLVSAT